MKAKIAALFFTIATSLQAQNNNLGGMIERDYSGRADTLEYVLTNQFLSSSGGTFYAIPRTYANCASESTYIYWQQAHALDVIIYAYQRIGDSNNVRARNYKRIMQFWYQNHANNWYHKNGDTTGLYNEYTDDMCWICLTLLHISEALGDDTYATTARKIFDEYILPRGSYSNEGFFCLPWKDDGSGPNACTNAPGCLLAAKLYQRYGEETYLQTAKELYAWEANVIKTKLNNDGRVEEPPLTYTQGTFGEAARQLYHITGDQNYMAMASKVLYYAVSSTRCTNKGLLRDEGSSMDQSIFKAVLIPYLVNYVLDEKGSIAYRKRFITFLQKNANTLWENLDLNAYPKTFCNYYWGEPIDKSKVPSMGAMVSGASLMENTARMGLALIANDSLTAIKVLPQEQDNTTTKFFNAIGQQLPNMQRGFNIIRYANNKTVKIIQR